MKKHYLTLFFLSIMILISCDNYSANNSGINTFPSNNNLMEQDPLLFAKAFINDIQGQASKEAYGKYLHSKARKDLEKGSRISIFLYKNALSENALLSNIKYLEMVVTLKNEGKTVFIRYKLPNTIKLNTAYPNSPVVGQGWVIKEGQITLDRDNDRWGVIGHTMNGIKENS